MQLLCPNCLNNDFKIFNLKYKVYMCKTCKLYFVKDIPEQNTFIPNHDENNRIIAMKNLRLENSRIIISKIEKYFGTKNILGLEVGSSHGWFLETAKNFGINCIGIEPESVTYESTAKKFKVIKGFYPNVLPDGEFNFIIFNDVFEHIPDLKKVMEANKIKLKKGGLLIINIPVSDGFIFKLSKILFFLGYKYPFNRLFQFDYFSPHYYYFNHKNLINFIEKFDFKFLFQHPLKVVDFDTIENRLKIDGELNTFNKISVFLIKKMKFIFKYLPSDTVCFYFKN